MLDRIRRGASLLRPRSLARMAARLDAIDKRATAVERGLRRQMRERDDTDRARLAEAEAAARHSAQLSEQVATLTSSIANMTASFAALQDELQQLRQRAEKTIAIVEADASDRRIAQLPKILQPERIAVHVRRAVGQAEVHLDPCPYMVVDELLPRDVYDVLVAAIPPRVLFEDRPVNKQQIKIPPPLAPALSRQVWHFMANEVLKGPLGDTVFERLKGPLLDYLHRFWPDYRLDDPEVPISVSDGRIILRRAGYVIPPHRDPRWGFITIILYLARPGDPAQWGTQFYRVRDDADAGTAVPYWIDEARCEQVRDVPFVANRAVVFVNSDGAHGASIPTDAPPDFERYICQWRLGPDSKAMKVLMSRLAPAHRAAWEGKPGY